MTIAQPTSPREATTTAPPMIVVDGVTVEYNGLVALRDARLTVPTGAICALIGMNGAGKSTLFKAIMGLVTPVAGRVAIEGQGVARAQRLGRVAYMPQAEEVDWAFPVSVQDVVTMGRYGFMNLLRIPRPLDKAKVAESLTRVGLSDFRDRQIGELSGGQRKRAFLARALAQDARIMLLDEPFTGIDAKTEEAILKLLRELRDEGYTIVICTHDLASIASFCDEVALINRTVIAHGPLAATFTPENIALAYGGVFNHLVFAEAAAPIARGGSLMFDALWHLLADPFQFAFMIKALAVGCMAGVVCATLSCFVTLKGWSLLSDAVSHAVLPGVVLAHLVGLPFGFGAFVSGLLAVLIIGWVSVRLRLRGDAAIGIVFTAFFGLGLILISKLPSLTEWTLATFGYAPALLDVRSLLFGNVLGISDGDIVQTFVAGGLVLALALLFRRDLLLFCFDPNHARAIGLNTALLHYGLLALLALTVVAALQTIGVVLVIAMLVTPGAIAYMLTDRFDRMLALAIGASVVACVSGVYASYYLQASTGGCIVFIQALLFLLALAFAPRRGLLARWRGRVGSRQSAVGRELVRSP